MRQTPKSEQSAFSSRLLVGEFQMIILRSVSILGSDAYGMNIRRNIEDVVNREIHMPQVYAALTRLENLGMVSSFIDREASAGRRGRARRVYSLEAPGQRMLEAGAMLSSPVPG